MKFDDEKVYKENEKDVSDDALAKSKSTELVRTQQERTEYKEKLRYYTFLKNNSSPVRFKHKQILFELYITNNQSWGRAKRLFTLHHLAKAFKLGLGSKIEDYLNDLVQEIQYEQIRLNNKELITQKAIETLEDAKTELDGVLPETTEDRIKLGYAKVNLARGYKQMLPKDPLIINKNEINAPQTTNNLNIAIGSNKTVEDKLDKIAAKYGITRGQAKQLAKKLLEAKKQAMEISEVEEVIDADTLIA